MSANQKSVILRTGVENGGQVEWDFAFSQYTSKYDTSFLIAATCSKDATRLYKYIQLLFRLKENQQFIVIDYTFEKFQFTGDDVGQ